MCTSTIMHLYYVKYNIHITCVLHIKHVHTTYSLSIYSYCKYTHIYIYIYIYRSPSYYSSGADIHNLSLIPSTSYFKVPHAPTPHHRGKGYHTLIPPMPRGRGVPWPWVGGGGTQNLEQIYIYICIYIYIYTCGWKLAWQGIWHEYAMMLRMRMLPNLLPVATCRQCPLVGSSHGQTACELASRGGSKVWNFKRLEILDGFVICCTISYIYIYNIFENVYSICI